MMTNADASAPTPPSCSLTVTATGVVTDLVDIVTVIGSLPIQKCAIAGAGVIVAVSAPTRMALDTAETAGITVVAGVRNGHGQVYTHPWRVAGAGGL